MRKLIPSKHFTNSCCDRSITQDGPKQLLFSNNWATRNDSANVALALQPEYLLNSRRKCFKNVPFKPSNTNNVYRKSCLGSNNCYCKETSIKPPGLLLRRPNKCLSLEEFEDRFHNKLNTKGRSSFHCFCKANSELTDHINRVQSIQNEFENENLKITDQRKEYEKFRDNEYDEYLKDIDQYRTLTIMSTRNPNTIATGSSEYVTEGLNSDDLNLFAKSTDEVASERECDIDKINGNTNKYIPRCTYSSFKEEYSDYLKSKLCGDKSFSRKTRSEFATTKNSSSEKSVENLITDGEQLFENRYTQNKLTSTKCVCKCNNHIPYEPNAGNVLSSSPLIQKDGSYLNVNGRDKNSTEMTQTNLSGDGSMNISDIRKFRDKNYFETHHLDNFEFDRNDVTATELDTNSERLL
ncbi:uncharacterized protein LOC130895178 isoform X2 [Diorhabda carinulata]|uniref:uncharacterized protein LOC130895178 isoform X2 n=1 Tax=Diorhabda carinulata TaxID=1163345 RepID=UPI0025A06B63|nr:uncharacterized protein LOC130895178 isoform X2 [Diorhabda carinulata]